MKLFIGSTQFNVPDENVKFYNELGVVESDLNLTKNKKFDKIIPDNPNNFKVFSLGNVKHWRNDKYLFNSDPVKEVEKKVEDRKVDYLTTIDFNDKIKKTNILLLPDVEGWAFDNIAKSIVKYNPYFDKINYDIKYIRDLKNNKNDLNLLKKYDYIYVFFEADRFIPDSKKVIRGCYSAFWLEDNNFTPIKIAEYFEKCNSSIFSNIFLKNSICKYLPNDYKYDIIHDSSDENLFYPIDELKKEKFTVIFVGNVNRKIKNFNIIKWICEKADVELIVCNNIKNNELVNFYNSADICINFSEFEGGPQTFIEASLCGIPMLIRNNNELGKIIPCFRAETKEEFVDILKKLKDNRYLCKEMGERARLVALKDFTYKKTANKFADFFLSLNEKNEVNYLEEFKDLSNELTVFLISCGTNPNYNDCKKSIENQTVNFKLKEIKDISPMSAAFQRMIDECDTKYYIQVDEDMILNENSIEIIYKSLINSDSKVSTIAYMLNDIHLDFNLYGIKGYKHDILKKYPYNLEIISCEVEQLKRLNNDGYSTLMIEEVIGQHSPKWTPELIYERYFDLMEKWKKFKYNWLNELPSKLFQIFKNDPSDINFYALMGAMNSLAVSEPIRKREKNFNLKDEKFEAIKKIVENNTFRHILNRTSSSSKILDNNTMFGK
jgi:glycosyltransferase involved in cell wall biosynthesis